LLGRLKGGTVSAAFAKDRFRKKKKKQTKGGKSLPGAIANQIVEKGSHSGKEKGLCRKRGMKRRNGEGERVDPWKKKKKPKAL